MPLGRVLVVDDEPQVTAMIRDLLIAWGYEVTTASSASEALELLPMFLPDAVLLDVLMPVISGAHVLDRLRAEYPNLPVVMITGQQDETTARQLLARGAFDYIRKPFTVDLLERVVAAAVSSRRH
jgi:CheY-like chemotaxis protein